MLQKLKRHIHTYQFHFLCILHFVPTSRNQDIVCHPLKDGTGAVVISDISEDGPREFTSQKISWNMINPIEVAEDGDKVDGVGPNTYSLGLLMVKHLNGHPEQYRFGSVKVKAGSTEEARTKIKTKITDLRAAYPLWSFIY